MSKNTQFIVLFSVVVIGAVLFAEYFIYTGTLSFTKPSQEPYKPPTNTPPAVTLPAPVKKALDFYKSKNSLEEERKHDTLVRSIAVASPVLTISQCIPNPTVLKVRLQDSITIKNDDAIIHTLARPLFLSLQIPPGSTKSFPVKDILKKEGVYQYACDNGPGLAGIFVVTAE